MHKYYTSITEIPVWNFWQLSETNDFTFLLIDSKATVCDHAQEAHEAIQSDFIKHFGISDKFQKVIRLQMDIEVALIKQTLTGDRSNTLIIENMKSKLNDLMHTDKGGNHFDELNFIEKSLGRKFDIRKESVYDFYKQIEVLVKWQKARK